MWLCPLAVRDNWEAICDFTDAEAPVDTGVGGQVYALAEAVNEGSNKPRLQKNNTSSSIDVVSRKFVLRSWNLFCTSTFCTSTALAICSVRVHTVVFGAYIFTSV